MISDFGVPRYIGLGGEQIAYHRFGHGPSVALIHGIPTWSYLWRDFIPPLIQDVLEIIAIDLLGYGDSDKPAGAGLGISAQAELVAAVLRKLNWNGRAIVGHDIGWGIVQLMCANDSETAERLVLIDAIAYDSFPEPGIARLKDPIWDNILSAPDFDLQKALPKGFTRGVVRKERITSELIAAYERPFRGGQCAGRASCEDRECRVIELYRVVAHLVGRAEDRYEIGGDRHEQGGVPGLSDHRAGRNKEKAQHDRKADKAIHIRQTGKQCDCGAESGDAVPAVNTTTIPATNTNRSRRIIASSNPVDEAMPESPQSH
jgi:pimeloyl-ACP methyl ester carboxylesterase